MDTVQFFHFMCRLLPLSPSLLSYFSFCFLPCVDTPRVKRTPVDAKRVSQFFLDGAEARKEKGRKKKEEEKPAIKRRRAAERDGKGGGRVYVTFDRTRKHNKSSEGCPVEAWRDANPVFHSFWRRLRLTPANGTWARVTRAVQRAKASLSLRRVPRFEIKHLASRPPVPPPAWPCMPVCVRVHACMYVHGCTRLPVFSYTATQL